MKKETEANLEAEATVMRLAMGAWVCQAMSTITRLDIPDFLEDHGPATAEDLVSKHGVAARPELLERTLRACASAGLVNEDAKGRFGPTVLTRVLAGKSPRSMKHLIAAMGATWWRLWGELEPILRTGESGPERLFGMSYWDYCQSNPKEMEDFGAAMRSTSQRSLPGILEHSDLSGARRVADIAGGLGHVAIAFLRHYEHLEAVVLDLPELSDMARRDAEAIEAGVRERLTFQPGDMFDSVPPADVYFLKHIIHDWHDEECKRILSNCRQSMIGEGKLLCVDVVLPPMGDTGGFSGKFFDVDMIAFAMGKERREEEWQALYRDSGFEIVAVTPLNDDFGTSLIEGRPV